MFLVNKDLGSEREKESDICSTVKWLTLHEEKAAVHLWEINLVYIKLAEIRRELFIEVSGN